jgi:hypothetical protein
MGDDPAHFIGAVRPEDNLGKAGLMEGFIMGMKKTDRLPPGNPFPPNDPGQIVDIPFIQARFGHLRIHLTAARLLSDMGAGFACLFRIRFRILLSRLRHAGA